MVRGQQSNFRQFFPGWKTIILAIAAFATYHNVKQLLLLNSKQNGHAIGGDRLLAAYNRDGSVFQAATGKQSDSETTVPRFAVEPFGDTSGHHKAGGSLWNPNASVSTRDRSGSSSGSNRSTLLKHRAVASAKPSGVVDPGACHALSRTEYLGTVVLWGASNYQDSAGACCHQCRSHEGCNTWVWCAHGRGCGGDSRYRECWLKSQPPLKLNSPDIFSQGEGVRWTSGLLYNDRQLVMAQQHAIAADAANVARLAALHSNQSLPLVFLNVSIGDVAVGRMLFVLFNEASPLQSENMRQLCTGERGSVPNDGTGRRGEGLPYHLQGKPFYRIIDRFIDQTGVDTESIYGGEFQDDLGGLALKHDRRGLLSAANKGPDSNTCHFSILMAPAPHLDGHYTIFGELVEGWHVAQKINGLSRGKPHNTAGREAGAVITASGQLRAGSPSVLPPLYRARLAHRNTSGSPL